MSDRSPDLEPDQIKISRAKVGSSNDPGCSQIKGMISDPSNAWPFYLSKEWIKNEREEERMHIGSADKSGADMIVTLGRAGRWQGDRAQASIGPAVVFGSKSSFQLDKEIQQLRLQVNDLQAQLKNVQKSSSPFEEKVIVLRELSHQEAKEEILALFKDGDVHDYGDIAERLKLDLQQVVEICNELEEEGVIG